MPNRRRAIEGLATLLIMTTSCATTEKNNDKTYVEPDIEVTDGKLTPEIVWQMGAVGSASLSPDGKTALFSIGRTDIKEDKVIAQAFSVSLDDSAAPRQLTDGETISQPSWTPDGHIAFIRKSPTKNNDGKTEKTPQLFVANSHGGGAKRMTRSSTPVEGFLFSPKGDKVALLRNVKIDKDIHDKHPDLPKANARIETDLMYRHWNDWADGSYAHIFIGKVGNNGITDETDIMEGERHHSPLRPFGGIEQIAWSPDGKTLAYTCKKLEGMASALSTNSDIFTYDTESHKTENISAPNKGYDTNPTFSTDGKALYWLSMERDGYESDRNRIMRLDLGSGERKDLTAGSELYVQCFALSDDGNDIWFIADKDGRDAIFHLATNGGEISQLTTDTADYTSLSTAGGRLIATRTTMFHPAEVYSIDTQTGAATDISKVNAKTIAKVKWGQCEERWLTTTDGKRMLTWVVLPPDFDKSKTYPTLLYCQGGPQSTVSQFWSRRWNFALMAANGYVVVAPNRRGLPGFGIEWNEQISKDYGGQNMKDYLTAIDELAKEPFVDSKRLGCVGASYGGFSVYWLAGHHEGRFKSFIAHCGIFNLDQLYSTTEEMFFVNWDLGGPYWDKSNAAAQKSFAQSPHLFVDKWDTPIMVIHGEKDFRIPYTQGMGAFNCAKLKGLNAEFLYFPDECHWVSKPQNSILWHREFFDWLNRTL